jgi:transposase
VSNSVGQARAVAAARPAIRTTEQRPSGHGEPVRGVVESMNGARFVHDELVGHGWEVLVADAQKVKGLAPLACKTDKIDSRVLAELSFRDLVPAIWLPTRSCAKSASARVGGCIWSSTARRSKPGHSTVIAFGRQVPTADLFGIAGRRLLAGLDIPEPWRGHVNARVTLIDDLELRISEIEHALKRSGADHRYLPLLMTAPGIGPITGFTIAAEIGDINRFALPVKLTGYTGLYPRVKQSGDMDQRGPVSKHGPRYRRWGLMEAAIAASSHPLSRSATSAPNERRGSDRCASLGRA